MMFRVVVLVLILLLEIGVFRYCVLVVLIFLVKFLVVVGEIEFMLIIILFGLMFLVILFLWNSIFLICGVFGIMMMMNLVFWVIFFGLVRVMVLVFSRLVGVVLWWVERNRLWLVFCRFCVMGLFMILVLMNLILVMRVFFGFVC